MKSDIGRSSEVEIPPGLDVQTLNLMGQFLAAKLDEKLIEGILSVLRQPVDNATVFELNPAKLRRSIENLFISARDEIFEDGMESRFSTELVSTIARYGDYALEVIESLILSESAIPEVASEALRWIGDTEHKATHEIRLRLLERSLSCSSPIVRDGAVLGLSFMSDPRAIGSLRDALKREDSKLLRRYMEQVLEELEGEI